jgi:hypothetical protein
MRVWYTFWKKRFWWLLGKKVKRKFEQAFKQERTKTNIGKVKDMIE